MKKQTIVGAIGLVGLGLLGGYMFLQKEESQKVMHPKLTTKSSSTSTTVTSPEEAFEQTENTTSPQRNLPELLQPYSDEEIEYARVWLAVMGADYGENLTEPNDDFELRVTSLPAGTPVNQFAEGRITYPVDTIYLAGKHDAQGQLVYSSNYDGTVTTYPIPDRWTYTEKEAADPAYLDKLVAEAAENTKIVPIPAGDPVAVKEIIEHLVSVM